MMASHASLAPTERLVLPPGVLPATAAGTVAQTPDPRRNGRASPADAKLRPLEVTRHHDLAIFGRTDSGSVLLDDDEHAVPVLRGVGQHSPRGASPDGDVPSAGGADDEVRSVEDTESIPTLDEHEDSDGVRGDYVMSAANSPLCDAAGARPQPAVAGIMDPRGAQSGRQPADVAVPALFAGLPAAPRSGRDRTSATHATPDRPLHRRRFAAPAQRSPGDASRVAGLVFVPAMGQLAGLVLRRNYRRTAVSPGPSTSALRRSTLQQALHSGAAATASGGAANPSGAGKRLRDRSSLRKPQHLEGLVASDETLDDTNAFLYFDEEEEDDERSRDTVDYGASSPSATQMSDGGPMTLQDTVAAIVARTAAGSAEAGPCVLGTSPLAAGHVARPVATHAYPPQYAPNVPGRPRKQKQCACCATTSTPLWRDIGRELPLCNACGIRWKKYGLICPKCNYVPCKQERDHKVCRRCTTKLPPASKKARMPGQV